MQYWKKCGCPSTGDDKLIVIYSYNAVLYNNIKGRIYHYSDQHGLISIQYVE